ncbi:sensor domain-containing diguanylate cyclase [Undibacterium flavidum]|uniref:diguanylate cyclase n=1 Tax=Undibacterium flavidum TaxID=2762297 RepID=A0ABR6Y892_9BURK|nr:diguanylate cyclase [Undibacterium flavidum]MBC3872833.1 diguanylate cyclase [Undibacterium flavidum]
MSSLEIYQNQILDSINMGLVIVDADEKILLWNAWMEKHSGISAEKAMNQKIEEAFVSVPSAAFMTALRNNITYGLPSVLSNALHRSPLALFSVDEYFENQLAIHQSIAITSLARDDNQRCSLIQISDSSTSIRREKMLRSHSEVLKKDATTDSLTGLYNRRFFDEHYKISLGQAIRQKHPLSIFMVDIDYFKQYNDYYGHPAGDKILIQVASTLKSQISRSSDMLARYGGEEFVMILPNMTEQNAMAFAEKLIDAVSQLALPHLKSKSEKIITISIGASTYDPNQHREVSALIDAADTALYKAKQQGRNQACLLPLDTLLTHRLQIHAE